MPDLVKGIGPKDAKIALIGMGPARDEIATGQPFTGESGKLLTRALNRLGISRNKVYLGNVSESYLQPGTSLFSKPGLNADIRRLANELEELKPNVVVPLGDEPFSIICGLNTITKWRGSILRSKLNPSMKCVPTVHPAWIVRGMWKWESVFCHIDLARALEESKFPEIKLPERNAIVGPSRNTILEYLDECSLHDDISLDIEVYGYTQRGTGEIGCVGIGYKPSEALCIPFTREGKPYWTTSDEAIIWRALAKLLQKEYINIIGQNLAFEWIYFWLHSIYPRHMYIDTMLLHHTLYPDFGGTGDVYGLRRSFDEPGHSLAFINSQYTRTPYYKDDGRRKSKGTGDYQWWEYNCKDVMVTMDAAYQMKQEAELKKVWDIYVMFKQKPFPHALRMEWYGMGVDSIKREAARLESLDKINSLQDRINKRLGFVLNVNSPKQIQDLLYGKMKLNPKKNRKTGKITADKHTLEEFAGRTQDEVLNWISELRHELDFKGDVLEQPLGETGRMHCHYKLGGTDTNRWSSTKSILGTGTNLQNIPARGLARTFYVPTRG